MPVAKAAVTGGLVITAIPEITAAAAMRAEAMVATAKGVTAAGVAATEASTLASVDLLPRRLFRFIPV